tara:strand:- start:876 stop:1388 length:513 start_codon:yes stop_codon:yes gene_type:complete
MVEVKDRGFTVIELVVSIALLAIVAVGTSSRWFSADAFSADTLKSQLLAEARLAQRTALSNSQVVVHLVVSQSSNKWRYQIFIDSSGATTLMREVQADVDRVTIQVTGGVSTTLVQGADLDLQYDDLGNLSGVTLAGVAGNVDSGLSFLLAGNRTFCISPLGFAHDGSCI